MSEKPAPFEPDSKSVDTITELFYRKFKRALLTSFQSVFSSVLCEVTATCGLEQSNVYQEIANNQLSSQLCK